MKKLTNLLKNRLSIHLYLIISIVLIYLIYLLQESLSNFQFSTFFLFLEILLFIYLSRYLSVLLSAILLMLILTFLIPYFIRILSLRYYSIGFAGIIDIDLAPSFIQIDTANYNFIIFNFIVLISFFFINSLFLNTHLKIRNFAEYLFSNRRKVENVLLVIVILHLFFTTIFGWKMGSESWKFGFISKILPITFFVNLFIFVAIRYWNEYYKYKPYKLIFILFLVVLNSLLLGSRSGIYFILLNLIFTYLLMYKNLSISLLKLLFFSVFIVFFGLIFFVFATGLRSGNSFEFSFTSSGLVFLDGLNRLSSSTDSFISIVCNYNNCLHNNELKDVASFPNLVKQFINSAVPGKVFDLSEFYIPATYFRTHVLGVSNLNFNGDLYSGYGWYFLKFKNFSYFIIFFLIIFYFLIINFLKKFEGIYFSFFLYFINWFTNDFFLHGSFVLSGLNGLLSYSLFIILANLIFKLKCRLKFQL